MNLVSSQTVPAGVSRAYPIGPGEAGLVVLQDDSALRVMAQGAPLMQLEFDEAHARLALRASDRDGNLRQAVRAIAAAVEALLGWKPELQSLLLDTGNDVALKAKLVSHGFAVVEDGSLVVHPELAMQRRENWLPDAAIPPFPLRYVMSNGKRHPQRPVKPEGLVYERFIPWLGKTVSFRALDPERDLHLFHRWMNDPRVDAFWSEAGSVEKHRDYLSKLKADPHMLCLIGCFGGEPFGYFEIYWAKENRIAPFYDVDDYDRGWHVAVGEDAYRGRAFISAWLPSLMHYMFLDDCRTQRIVGEPAAIHHRQIRNLERSGFARIKNFDFPHKRATLVMLMRERFFGDRLWLPASSDANTTV
jgi:acetyl CoA:N6-hydroxylysine acetyl transferase